MGSDDFQPELCDDGQAAAYTIEKVTKGTSFSRDISYPTTGGVKPYDPVGRE